MEGVKPGSETHNLREKDFDYVIKDRSDQNESWSLMSVNQKRKDIETRYKNSVGQKMQASSVPIREGVVVMQKHHTMDDLKKVASAIEAEYNLEVFQIHIHRDEGQLTKDKTSFKTDETGQELINYHAHLLINWTDENGKRRKISPGQMASMQDTVAATLGMERGKRGSKGSLNALEYKIKKREEELQELEAKMEKQQQEMEELRQELERQEKQIQRYRDIQRLEQQLLETGKINLKEILPEKGLTRAVDKEKAKENIQALFASNHKLRVAAASVKEKFVKSFEESKQQKELLQHYRRLASGKPLSDISKKAIDKDMEKNHQRITPKPNKGTDRSKGQSLG